MVVVRTLRLSVHCATTPLSFGGSKELARSMRSCAAVSRYRARSQVSFRMPSPGQQQPRRRRTDGDGNDALRAAHRAIAEHAYRLFAERGRDRSRVTEYWRLAEQAWMDQRESTAR
jgi:hypothetical protein